MRRGWQLRLGRRFNWRRGAMKSAPGASCKGPEWEAVTGIGSRAWKHVSNRRLLGALLTTYQPPSPQLLVEDLLPEWLGLERTAPGDNSQPDERFLFYLELDRRLKELHGQLSIFC